MSQVTSLAHPWEIAHHRRLRQIALALVVIGLIWRCSRYFLAFPIWGDEAMLLVNYFTRGYLDLFGPIDGCQIAPLLFHICEMTAFQWLGPSEVAVRLPAFVICLASLPLFWHVTRRLLSPLGHTLAVAIFSVSIWPATMGALVKPYAFDLFVSLGMTALFVEWLRDTERRAWLVALILALPLAMMASYPAVFVAGGIGAVLMAEAWQRRDRGLLALGMVYGVVLAVSFGGHYLLVGMRHLNSPVAGVTTAVGMDQYWSNAFPPLNPFKAVLWFFLVHTGQMAAYPLGAASGGSILTASLALVGLVVLVRQGHGRVVGVILVTFGLWFLASLLRKYPYGLSCRLSQHVAAFYCLTAGMGAAAIILRLTSDHRKLVATLGVCGVLATIGLGGSVRDFLYPYRELKALEARQKITAWLGTVGSEPIYRVGPEGYMDCLPSWYLGLYRGPLFVADLNQGLRPGADTTVFWVFAIGDDYPDQTRIDMALGGSQSAWMCVERRVFLFQNPGLRAPVFRCQAFRYVRNLEGDPQLTRFQGEAETPP